MNDAKKVYIEIKGVNHVGWRNEEGNNPPRIQTTIRTACGNKFTHLNYNENELNLNTTITCKDCENVEEEKIKKQAKMTNKRKMVHK